jgi:hypothetical protein
MVVSIMSIIMLISFIMIGISIARSNSKERSPSYRAEKMLQLMSLEEKLSMIRGSLGVYVSNIEGHR